MKDKDLKKLNLKKAIILSVWTVVIFFLVSAGSWAADQFPRPTGMAVNDFASVIDPENKAKMESLAREILQKTGASVVVATVSTIGENEEITMYVNRLYQAWGIGKKGEDRGVLIFLAVKDRKIRIEPGYGLEGILPDGLVGEILDKYVVPHLRTGETGKALYNAMLACGAYIAKDKGVQLTGVAGPYRSTKSAPKKKGISLGGIIVFLICAAVLLGTRTGRQMLPWILLMMLGGGRGGDRDGGFGDFGGFGGGMSGGGGAGRDF